MWPSFSLSPFPFPLVLFGSFPTFALIQMACLKRRMRALCYLFIAYLRPLMALVQIMMTTCCHVLNALQTFNLTIFWKIDLPITEEHLWLLWADWLPAHVEPQRLLSSCTQKEDILNRMKITKTYFQESRTSLLVMIAGPSSIAKNYWKYIFCSSVEDPRIIVVMY